MNLDTKDRLILSNQLRILEFLDAKNADEHARSRKIVERGYESSYDSIIGNIFEPTSETICHEVIGILSMYRSLHDSFVRLENKSELAERGVEFQGSDGNNEAKHLSYAAFLIDDEGQFEESKGAGDRLNSHFPVLEMYRRMLRVWRPMSTAHILTKQEIQRVLAEQVHPDQRSK